MRLTLRAFTVFTAFGVGTICGTWFPGPGLTGAQIDVGSVLACIGFSVLVGAFLCYDIAQDIRDYAEEETPE